MPIKRCLWFFFRGKVPTMYKLSLMSMLLLLAAGPAWALPRLDSVEILGASKTNVLSAASRPVLLAEAKTKSGKGVREKHIIREGRTKKGDQRNIDFDAVDISGERKTPLGTMVNNNKLDKNYDFVKIRLRWHPEMVQSASSLESGGSR